MSPLIETSRGVYPAIPQPARSRSSWGLSSIPTATRLASPHLLAVDSKKMSASLALMSTRTAPGSRDAIASTDRASQAPSPTMANRDSSSSSRLSPSSHSRLSLARKSVDPPVVSPQIGTFPSRAQHPQALGSCQVG